MKPVASFECQPDERLLKLIDQMCNHSCLYVNVVR